MALTPLQRKALELASEKINRREHIHLCYALTAVSGDSGDYRLWAAVSTLKNFVMAALFPHSTLDDWIADRHRLDNSTPVPNTNDERRQARIQWIDWFLDENAPTAITDPLKLNGPTLPSLLGLDRNITINSPRDRRPVRLNTWRP